MDGEATGVLYNEINGSFWLDVRQLDAECLTDEVTWQALRLQVAAYSANFENPQQWDQPLPPGTVAAHYRPDDTASIKRRYDAMQSAMQKGSKYWIAGNSEVSDGGRIETVPMSGLVKLSPSRASLPQKARIENPNLYINDIFTDPRLWHFGVGGAALHAACKFSGYDQSKIAVLDAYSGSSVNEWFSKLGFEPIEDADIHPVKIGEHVLPQVRMTTEGAVTIGGLVRFLESSDARLLTAFPR